MSFLDPRVDRFSALALDVSGYYCWFLAYSALRGSAKCPHLWDKNVPKCSLEQGDMAARLHTLWGTARINITVGMRLGKWS